MGSSKSSPLSNVATRSTHRLTGVLPLLVKLRARLQPPLPHSLPRPSDTAARKTKTKTKAPQTVVTMVVSARQHIAVVRPLRDKITLHKSMVDLPCTAGQLLLHSNARLPFRVLHVCRRFLAGEKTNKNKITNYTTFLNKAAAASLYSSTYQHGTVRHSVVNKSLHTNKASPHLIESKRVRRVLLKNNNLIHVLVLKRQVGERSDFSVRATGSAAA